jgi:hypothetical protein
MSDMMTGKVAVAIVADMPKGDEASDLAESHKNIMHRSRIPKRGNEIKQSPT